MYYDAHCHYNLLANKSYPSHVIAAVSMDYSSSLQTLNLAKNSNNILSGVGIHPWNIKKEKIEENEIIDLVKEADFIGEVGLDYRINVDKKIQIDYFEKFLELAHTFKKTVNIHSVDSYADVLNLLLKHDIKNAIIHWYSGPVDLLKDIESAGYFITINPSVTFQKKHQLVAEKAPLNIILTESDGGYEYKGKLLEPSMIKDSLHYLSSIKELTEEEINKIIENNFYKAFQFH
ncbi:TatD family deoxyribonuclease [Acidianus sulfidivorans JP7]|uniref:Hydrolase TatD n=1 Tax=Acidianus sulfidivorans JP7 TaxID=619593 RepID=A0A2U9INV5_9CREN|nr:TatD family hydrolase [Acidianus sulfidivorans]AWR97681.1 TatD family deoxyribonuclease [Acidianus sulfidivorans JP7]